MTLIITAVVIYDRFYNLLEWVRCWNLCETTGSKLVFIHNYANKEDKESYKKFCDEAGFQIIQRENIGFDIGAFQDVCRNRLNDFPEFDYLLWVTDDVLPMRKDFIKQYLDCFTEGIGCAAMSLSPEIKLHIRTTAFCITREVANKLQFHADPITNKWECYQFEHKEPDSFLEQLQKLDIDYCQVAPIQTSPFWDTGNKKTKSRHNEHYIIFPDPEQSPKKVAVICPVYNSYPEIISSMINQTHQNWVLYLIHDGPSKLNIKAIVDAYNDSRIIYFETHERAGCWGHTIRRDWLQELGPDVDYVFITNADNHHTPNYCEMMVRGFKENENAIAVYCSAMVHSYVNWGVINCKLKQGYLDCAGVMIQRGIAQEIGFEDVKSHSADWIFFERIIKKYGEKSFAMVKGCLLIHS